MRNRIVFAVLGVVTGVLIYLALPSAEETAKVAIDSPSQASYKTATFAAGCFWCTEAVFQETDGVVEAISGYAGGTEENPTYEDVYTNSTGHREAVQITYDSQIVSYLELLGILWKNIDPTDAGGQFVDRGFSYTTAIFVHSAEQLNQATLSKDELEASGRFSVPVVTEILDYTTFYKAETYHQDFYKKSAGRYESYESNSGREEFKAYVWQDIQAGEE